MLFRESKTEAEIDMDDEELFKLDWANMTQEELLERFPCQMDIFEQVYGFLFGDLIPSYTLPWVENIFEPGKPCHEAYGEMLRAYERLCERLGEADEDQDVEIIINSLLRYSKIRAKEMFKYGMQYQKMQDAEEKHNPEA